MRCSENKTLGVGLDVYPSEAYLVPGQGLILCPCACPIDELPGRGKHPISTQLDGARNEALLRFYIDLNMSIRRSTFDSSILVLLVSTVCTLTYVTRTKDVRVRGLIDVEQRRLDRLRAALDRHTPSIKKNALAFLGTAAGKEAVASRLATAPPASESEAEAKQEMVRRFVWREQALIRHDFNTTSPPPPLCCPRSDSCDATFVDRGHALHHAADVHPTDSPGVAELSVTMRDPVGLAVFEEFVEAAAAAAEPDGKGSFTRQASSDEQPPVKQSDQGSTPASSVGAAARDTLDVWNAIQGWRLISSDQKRFQQLGEAIIVSRTKYPHLPDDVRVALGGEQLRRLFGEMGATHGGKPNKKLLPGRANHSSTLQRPSPPRIGDDARVTTVDPSALEEASFRAVAFLSECQIGLAFLGSAPYRTYLDGVHKPMRDAVEAAAAEIAAAEEAEWAAEAHSLRKAALDREQEAQVESLANQATRVVLQGAVGASLLGGLIDDQVNPVSYDLLPPLLCKGIFSTTRMTRKTLLGMYDGFARYASSLLSTALSKNVDCVLRKPRNDAHNTRRSTLAYSTLEIKGNLIARCWLQKRTICPTGYRRTACMRKKMCVRT